MAVAVVRFVLAQDSSRVVAAVAFTPYAAAGALLAFTVVLLLRRWLAIAVAGAAVLALALTILPRAIGEEDAAAAGAPSFVVLTNNTRFGSVSPRALARLARRSRADVLSLQELTPGLVERLDAVDGFRRRFPHRVLKARDGASGTGLFSRRPLEPVAAPEAPGHEMTAARAELRGIGALELVSVHPVAPRGALETATWRAALHSLPAAGRSASRRVLAGDFNATLDHAELRRVIAGGYVDAAERSGDGLVPTYPAQRRLPALLTIDHVLADRRLAVLGTRTETLPGSDHRAVVARLAAPGS